MANLNLKATKQNSFDAIVIGSGISGGWAAKELCEKGLKTLVLEKGRMVKHIEDYPTMNMEPWDFPNRGRLTPEETEEHHIQMRSGFVNEANKHFFANDLDNPYDEVQRFDWVRAHVVGGRSLLWGKQCYRWSDLDFEANAKEGVGIDWPIRYKDIAPWYDYVEKFAGISGEKLGLPHLPDGQFLPPMELNCVEKHLRESIQTTYDNRYLTIGRVAHLTEAINGRGKCMYRNRCNRGCPYGAYFSSNAVTIPAAEATGNLTLRPNSVVSHIIFDDEKNKAVGVAIVDEQTMETFEFYAKIIFTNASALSSTAILLRSVSERFPNGMGNDSGELGHNVMDHHYRIGAVGYYDGFEDQYYKGRRPNGIYIPRYRNIDNQSKTDKYLRGYGYQGKAERLNWGRGVNTGVYGESLKEDMFKPGPWRMTLTGFGECLPYHENKVTINHDLKDKWGLSTLSFDVAFKENELNMRQDMMNDANEMLENAGMRDVIMYDNMGGPGKGIHEMGTARMGNDPKTAVLNKYNQVHGAPNVFVTDGACMTSSSCVNPSITYMALTARAANHAVEELKKMNL